MAAPWLLIVSGCASTGTQSAQTAGPASAWVARSAIYELFVRDFTPAGDFRGVTENLGRIQETGANVIWLMPIHPVGVLNRKGPLGSSYSITDYRGINPEYGNQADFRALVDAVHARGMKIIIDFVPNHTAWDHAWVRQAPARYTRNQRGEMTEPRDNDGKLTGWSDVADLDYSNPDTRRAVVADMRYWLDVFDIDGFRVDVAGMVPDDFWPDALRQLRTSKADILLLAEWGEPKMHTFGFDLTYGWDTYQRAKAIWKGESAATFVQRELADIASLPAGGQRLRFTTNHDETAWDATPVEVFGGAAGARAAFVAVALLPGVPLLYNGQEVESPQKLGLFVKEPIEWAQPDAVNARAFYRRIIDLARSLTGDLTVVETNAPDDVIAYARGNVTVLVNVRSKPIQVTPRIDIADRRDLLSGAMQTGSTITLPAHGALVLAR